MFLWEKTILDLDKAMRHYISWSSDDNIGERSLEAAKAMEKARDTLCEFFGEPSPESTKEYKANQ